MQSPVCCINVLPDEWTAKGPKHLQLRLSRPIPQTYPSTSVIFRFYRGISEPVGKLPWYCSKLLMYKLGWWFMAISAAIDVIVLLSEKLIVKMASQNPWRFKLGKATNI